MTGCGVSLAWFECDSDADVGLRLRARGALALAAVAALALQLPEQVGDLERAIPIVRLWAQPDEQYRAVLGDVPFDLLRSADARMPRDATVLLVTPGADVRRREYATFHRALYFLAPRPVRWITPAPSDGTWEARWWRTSEIDASSICEAAREAGATHLLLLDLQAPDPPCPGPRWEVEALPGGALVAAGTSAPSSSSATAPPGTIPPALPPTPWWPVLLAFALAIPMLLGGALVAAALRRGPALEMGQLAALAWILGAGAVTLGELWLGALGFPAALRLAVLATCGVAAGAWLLLAWRRRASAARRDLLAPTRAVRNSPWSPFEGLMAVALAAQVVLVAILAVGQPLSIWDGWAHWGMKARTIFLEGGVTPAVYADLTRASTHLAYPLHVPLLDSWVYGWLGVPDDRLVGAIGLATFVALLAFSFGTLRRWGLERGAALAITAVLGSLAHVWRLAAAGYADVPAALLLAAAVVLLVEWLERGGTGALVLGAATAGLLGWTKMEGLVLLVILLALMVAAAFAASEAALRRRARQAIVGLTVLGVALSGGWWAFALGHAPDLAEYDVAISTLLANAERLPTIVSMQAAMLVSPEWSLVWPLAAFLAAGALSSRWPRGSRKPAGRVHGRPNPSFGWLLPACAGLALVILSGAYLVTTFEPYTAQVESSGFRLAVQALPITLLWIGRQSVRMLPGPRQTSQPDEPEDP